MSTKITPPIAIFGNPRSGTSAVAAVFAAHGAWFCPHGQKHPYITYEWRKIKHIIKPPGTPILTGFPIVSSPEQQEHVTQTIIKSECPHTKDWIFKSTPELFSGIKHLSPRLVMVHRDHNAILRSQLEKTGDRGHFTKEEHSVIIKRRFRLMEEILENHRGFWVDADELINGNIEQFRPIFKEFGMIFHEDKALGAINREHWHYKRGG